MRRTVLLTGTSSGIGKAIATLLLKQGHTVIGLCRTNTLKAFDAFHFYPVDLEKTDQLEKSFKIIQKDFPTIDTVICNAGKGVFGFLEQFSTSQIQKAFDLNFLSHVLLIRFFLPSLKKKDLADIVFIGSEAALQGKKQGSLYCAAKFGLRGFAQALRDETAVRVSIIQPGMTQTAFFDSLHFQPQENSFLKPESIAEAILMVLNLEKGAVCDEIILSPLKKSIKMKKSVRQKIKIRRNP